MRLEGAAASVKPQVLQDFFFIYLFFSCDNLNDTQMIGFHRWVSGVPRWHTVPPSVCQTCSCLPKYLRYPGIFTMQMMHRSIFHTTTPKNIFHELHRAAPGIRPACFIEQRITNVSKISKLIKVISSQPQACPGEQINFTFIEYSFNSITPQYKQILYI